MYNFCASSAVMQRVPEIIIIILNDIGIVQAGGLMCEEIDLGLIELTFFKVNRNLQR